MKAHPRSTGRTGGLLVILSTLASPWLLACSNASFQAATSDGGAPADSGNTGGGEDGSTPSDGGPPTRNSGSVSMTSLDSTLAGNAFFYATPTACTRTPIGASCIDQLCATDGAASKLASAGAITVTGGPGALDFVADASGAYNSPSSAVPGDGTTFLVTATGAQVPAFHGNVVMPSRPVVSTEPFASANTSDIVLSTAQDLSVTWVSSANANLAVAFSPAAQPSGHTRGLVCSFTSSPSIVPVAMLKALGAGGTYGVVATTSTFTSAGNWDIALTASAVSKSTFGVLLSGNYTTK